MAFRTTGSLGVIKWPRWRIRNRVGALDLRGYNLSEQARRRGNYSFDHLLSDVTAMISDLGETRTVVVGHDVGGFVAWNLAMNHPRWSAN